MHFLLLFLVGFTSASVPKHKTIPKIRCQSNGECFCPEEPLTERYVDPEDPTCQSYYLCHLNRAFRRACEVRKAFHPEKGECVPRQQVPEKYCNLPVKCPVFRNMYVEDPQDCTKYYLCFYQRPSHYSCPETNYFDPEKQKCIHDAYTAEACQEQANVDLAEKLKIEPEVEISSSALKKAKGNVASLIKTKGKIEPSPPKHFMRQLDPVGKAFMGGRRNLF